MGYGVWGMGYPVWGIGYRVSGIGYGVVGMEYGVVGMGYGVWGMGYGVWGIGHWALSIGLWILGIEHTPACISWWGAVICMRWSATRQPNAPHPPFAPKISTGAGCVSFSGCAAGRPRRGEGAHKSRHAEPAAPEPAGLCAGLGHRRFASENHVTHKSDNFDGPFKYILKFGLRITLYNDFCWCNMGNHCVWVIFLV